MIKIGVLYFPKNLFPFYLADINVLFEKQSHYPLIVIGNCNLLCPQICEGHIYWKRHISVKRALTGQLKYKMQKWNMAATKHTRLQSLPIGLDSPPLHLNYSSTSKFKICSPASGVFLMILCGARGKRKSRDEVWGAPVSPYIIREGHRSRAVVHPPSASSGPAGRWWNNGALPSGVGVGLVNTGIKTEALLLCGIYSTVVLISLFSAKPMCKIDRILWHSI